MLRRLECYVICAKCDKKVGTVMAEAQEDRPEFWSNRPDPDPIPKRCPACNTITCRVTPTTFTIR